MAKSKSGKVSKTQVGDQIAKGGVMGLVVYFATKGDIDPELLAICMPLIAGVMAVVSSKVGDPAIASFFDAAKKAVMAPAPAPVVAAKAPEAAAKAPAKKAAGRPKKAAPKK
jgi:hypothetical protein